MIDITPNDPRYKANATYFIGIAPKLAISDLFGGFYWNYAV
jgi:hypothetical protein